MKPEIEVKFLDVNHDDLRARLKQLDAVCIQPLQQMCRAVMDFPDKRLQNAENAWGWIRVRDEGSRVTVTYKQVAKDASLTTNEIEYVASSYSQAVAAFEAVGLIVLSEQETKRETWTLDNCEVMLDEWPWIKPYIEVEGPDERSIQTLSERLGMRWASAVYGSSDAVYRASYKGMKESESVGDISQLTFAEMPEWLKERL